MFVRIRKFMTMKELGDKKFAFMRIEGWTDGTGKLDVESDLFFCLSYGGFDRIFIELNMSAGRQPPIQFIVYTQKDFIAVHDIYI